MAGAPLHLAVYVVGFSGHSSQSYVGCGKSCLCRQFMYNEYSEEPCSTLLQAEFDGCVINQQHVIYWGQKAVTYTSEKEKNLLVNFDVFEHTLLYKDDTGLPFKGEKYEKRIFIPLKAFLNKYHFKSREEILYPEEYSAKRFTYVMILQVAYLYVVDVSQSCPVFLEQLQLMETLIHSIKKNKHHCVILATKFDSYSKENYKKLESCASKLKVDVIQSSSKYDTNIDTAFKHLAVKSLQLKKKRITVSVLTHADCAVEKRRQSGIGDADDVQKPVSIDEIPHISLVEQPQKWPMFIRGDSSDVTTTTSDNPSLLVEDYDSHDSFDSGSDYDEPHEEMTENNNTAVEKSSLDSKIYVSGSDCTQPLNTANNFGSLQDLASTPRSATLSMPLPKLPFESDGNSTPQERYTNLDNPTLVQKTMPKKDIISQISEQVKKGPATSPRPIRNPLTLSPNPEGKKHDKDDVYININKQICETENYDASDDAYEEINSADEDYIKLPLLPSTDESGRDVTALNESKIASILHGNNLGNVTEIAATMHKTRPTANTSLIHSTKAKETAPNLSPVTKYKRSPHYYKDIDFDLTGGNSKVSPPPHSTVEPNTHRESATKEIKISSESVVNTLKTKQVTSGFNVVKRSPHYYEDVGIGFLRDKLKVSPHGKAASQTDAMLEVKKLPAGDAAHKPGGKRISATELIYDDTISQTAKSQGVATSLDDANSAITVQPIYSNTSVNRSRESVFLQSAGMGYVRMYKVKQQTPALDDDQTLDTRSDVYAYDYVYHRSLRLRKHGKDCGGVPPRNIRRPDYIESPHYVNIDTQHDYVNFNTKECSIVSPPRACSTYRSPGKSDHRNVARLIPKRRANMGTAVLPRNIPRQGYYLSGPSAVPSTHI